MLVIMIVPLNRYGNHKSTISLGAFAECVEELIQAGDISISNISTCSLMCHMNVVSVMVPGVTWELNIGTNILHCSGLSTHY